VRPSDKGVTSAPMRDTLRHTGPSAAVLLLACGVALASAACAPEPTQTTAQSAPTVPMVAKNIILMISDGCGYNHVDTADYYQGSTGAYEGFPVRLAMTTYPYDGTQELAGYDPARMWQDFGYSLTSLVTDSAAAATALASGVKTYSGAIGVGPDGTPIESVVERAERLGKATGVVTTVPWSHATPAAFAAHTADRYDYSEIARQIIQESAVDVVMGAGNPDFDNDGLAAANDPVFVGGVSLWTQLKDADAATPTVADADGDGAPDPWTLLQTKADFETLATADTTPLRVCGTAQVYSTLQQARAGSAFASPYAVPANSSVPDLATMVEGALNVLDNDADGFFLMVEGGAVDWASLLGETGRMIEEQAAFNDAVAAVVEWILGHGGWEQTLLVVTADHETGMLWGPGAGTVEGAPVYAPIADQGKGVVPGVSWNSIGHTNQLVPLYAVGVGSQQLIERARLIDPVRGRYLDNTDVGRLILGTP
jgi:alkaline phosphatase